MDALSDVLRAARLKGGVFLQAEFTAPWCLAGQMNPDACAPYMAPPPHLIPYHYVLEGEMVISEGEGEPPVDLSAGDLVLFPYNDFHVMGSAIDRSPKLAAELLTEPPDGSVIALRHGGGGERVRLVCGFLGCEEVGGNPVLATLPRMLVLSCASEGRDEWVRANFNYAASEVAAGRAGSEAIVSKLSEMLFVEAVRRHAESLPEGQTGWLAGLRDPYVAKVLALFHGDDLREWSNDSLAREVGLSRSALSDRFSRLIGQPPIQYLAHWRLQLAARRLRETAETIAQVAAAAGYESEASFSKAFKKRFGTAPAGWRREAAG